ncbi:hypothetical protein CJ030_MR1G027741 [Morella rubra]|uniref:Phorbol-ester/DAG-type domain-containing protein n=1 Tax=Morella rubra TaxID=262757 RepID=A0A6A1WWV4_9ROSI|nr:hypothetical protein CJ030_MR1G027741 [Morella rubra]
MFYICTTCPFVVHLKCSSITLSAKPPTIDAEIHEHPLILVPRSSPFTCDACGKEDKARFYFCTICSFVVHQKCTSLSSTVKVLIHKQHPLNVIYSLQDNQSHRKACPICAQTVNTNYRFYYCSSCDFLTHLHCAITVDRDEKSLWSGIDVSPYDVVKKMKLGEDGNGIAVEIKHFNHEHELKLTDELDMKEQCDGCVLPIFPPFYSCTICRFFLHKSCAELPRKKQQSHHRHPLILRTRHTWCNACQRISKGFKYSCVECRFNLDVQCSLVPNILKHDGHEHQLICFHSSDRVKCSCCDSSSNIYFVVAIVNLCWTSSAQHYHIQQFTDRINILSNFGILLKMTLVNIIAIYVKKNEIQNMGSITVQLAIMLLIQTAFSNMSMIGTSFCI